jgi:hypothetical protein
MKHAVEKCSLAVIIGCFTTLGHLDRGGYKDTQYGDCIIPLIFFQNKESRLKTSF